MREFLSLLQIWWRAPCGGFLPLLALRGNSHRGEFEGHVEQNFTVHGWSCSCCWEFTILYTWYPQQHIILFNRCLVKHPFVMQWFWVIQLKQPFQVDVSGSRYLYVYKVSPYQFVNRVNTAISRVITPFKTFKTGRGPPCSHHIPRIFVGTSLVA